MNDPQRHPPADPNAGSPAAGGAPPPGAAEARPLVDALCEGRLDRAGARRLEALVRTNADARRLYVRAMFLHASLHQQAALLRPAADDPLTQGDAGLAVGDPMQRSMVLPALDPADLSAADDGDDAPPLVLPPSPPTATGHRPRPGRGRWLVAAAAAVVVAAAGSAIVLTRDGGGRESVVGHPVGPAPVSSQPGAAGRDDGNAQPDGGQRAVAPPAEPPDPGATLAGTAFATWGGPAPSAGARLDGRSWHLTGGVAELTTGFGASVVVEGPAEFTVESARRLRLTSGRLAAVAPTPAAHGLTVVTPAADVVDLGTEFGVAVGASGRTTARVYDGRVRVAPPGPAANGGTPAGADAGAGGSTELRAGEAAGTEPGKPVARLSDPASAGAFVRPAAVAKVRRLDPAVDPAGVLALAHDPDVLAYTLFDPATDAVVRELGLPGAAAWRAAPNDLAPSGDGGKSVAGHPAAAPAAAAFAPAADRVPGNALRTDGQSPVFVDLDLSPTSPLARAGLVGPDGKLGGAPGRSLYVGLLMAADTSAGGSDYAGLSLMDGNERRTHEYLFVGRANRATHFSYHVHPLAEPTRPAGLADLDADPATPGVQPAAVDARGHLVVLRVNVRDGGKATVRFYLDPKAPGETGTADGAGTAAREPTEPTEPAGSVDVNRLRFDRLRLASSGGQQWRFARVVVGSSFRAAAAAGLGR